MKYAVICYAVHGRCVSSISIFDTYADADDFLQRDAQACYEQIDSAEIHTEQGRAEVTTVDDCYWTWEIEELHQQDRRWTNAY